MHSAVTGLHLLFGASEHLNTHSALARAGSWGICGHQNGKHVASAQEYNNCPGHTAPRNEAARTNGSHPQLLEVWCTVGLSLVPDDGDALLPQTNPKSLLHVAYVSTCNLGTSSAHSFCCPAGPLLRCWLSLAAYQYLCASEDITRPGCVCTCSSSAQPAAGALHCGLAASDRETTADKLWKPCSAVRADTWNQM